MAGRTDRAATPLPAFLQPADHERRRRSWRRAASPSASAASRRSQGVDIAVRDRTLHALIGPNGAGKTTAFNLISGLFAPDAARSTLGGRSIAGLRPERITAAGVGRSFQITNLFPALSVEENVRLAVQARHRAAASTVWRDARAHRRRRRARPPS